MCIMYLCMRPVYSGCYRISKFKLDNSRLQLCQMSYTTSHPAANCTGSYRFYRLRYHQFNSSYWNWQISLINKISMRNRLFPWHASASELVLCYSLACLQRLCVAEAAEQLQCSVSVCTGSVYIAVHSEVFWQHSQPNVRKNLKHKNMLWVTESRRWWAAGADAHIN